MNKIAIFENQKIRKIFHAEEWWFVIKDVIFALTDSKNPSDYLKKLRKRDNSLNELFKGGGQFVPPLGFEFETKGGIQIVQCWNTKGLLRLVQSIPSKKAEPFKQWLAQVGYERIEEIEDPELGQNRIKEYYELKGYPKHWIDKRLRGIAIRQELTDEWKNREVKTKEEFAILTNEISKATFGKTIGEYKEFKQLKKQNLRDHMTDLELIFTMLGEKTTTEITKERNSQGFTKCKESAKEGGEAAKDARESVERRLGKSTISKDNFLPNKKE